MTASGAWTRSRPTAVLSLRVLVLHSRYLSGSVSGENRVVEDEVALLRDAGHFVELLSPEPQTDSRSAAVRTGLQAISNRAAAGAVAAAVRELRPDVVHCHNLFPTLSPSVLPVAARHARLVMTLHNFRFLCLPATFLRDGRPCEDCLGKLPWRGVARRCYRGSLAASGALAASLAFDRVRGGLDRVDRFLAVSDFVRRRYLAAGFAPERVRVKANFSWDTGTRVGAGKYFLYLGRLTAEKGIDVLVRDWSHRVGTLVVAGDGPLRDQLQRDAPAGVEFRGEVMPDEVPSLLRDARALCVPSIWYEGGPRSIIEAFGVGVPVVASRIGGLPELVRDGKNGLLVEVGDRSAWRNAFERLADDGEAQRLGAGARQSWLDEHSPATALAALEEAYT